MNSKNIFVILFLSAAFLAGQTGLAIAPPPQIQFQVLKFNTPIDLQREERLLRFEKFCLGKSTAPSIQTFLGYGDSTNCENPTAIPQGKIQLRSVILGYGFKYFLHPGVESTEYFIPGFKFQPLVELLKGVAPSSPLVLIVNIRGEITRIVNYKPGN